MLPPPKFLGRPMHSHEHFTAADIQGSDASPTYTVRQATEACVSPSGGVPGCHVATQSKEYSSDAYLVCLVHLT